MNDLERFRRQVMAEDATSNTPARGRGRGNGRGQGRGGGRGMGMARRGGQELCPSSQNAFLTGATMDQLQQIGARLAELRRRRANLPTIAVDARICSACGVCEVICQNGAISVQDVAHVNKHACIGCGLCVEACPEDALSLK